LGLWKSVFGQEKSAFPQQKSAFLLDISAGFWQAK